MLTSKDKACVNMTVICNTFNALTCERTEVNGKSGSYPETGIYTSNFDVL